VIAIAQSPANGGSVVRNRNREQVSKSSIAQTAAFEFASIPLECGIVYCEDPLIGNPAADSWLSVQINYIPKNTTARWTRKTCKVVFKPGIIDIEDPSIINSPSLTAIAALTTLITKIAASPPTGGASITRAANTGRVIADNAIFDAKITLILDPTSRASLSTSNISVWR
jgi:hypothetical protein